MPIGTNSDGEESMSSKDNPVLVHCSYHKCMTGYFATVAGAIYETLLPWTRGYRHFDSLVDDFYRELGTWSVASVNNHSLELDRLGNFRITRFIRDPRDLIVSGYHYHKRAAEPWCSVIDPTDEDWRVVNGHVPEGLRPGESYAAFLKRVPVEEGLRAEMYFRRRHFASMLAWPEQHPHIRVFRYEDILGHEKEVFEEIFDFYGANPATRKLAGLVADRRSARRRRSRLEHIRNPEPRQWARLFTPALVEEFDVLYGAAVQKLGY